jgi:hypothetical protein
LTPSPHPDPFLPGVSSPRSTARFTVKKYHSELSTGLAVTAAGWRHDRIQLLPLNPTFEPITLEPEDAGDLTIVGAFVCAADRSSALHAAPL